MKRLILIFFILITYTSGFSQSFPEDNPGRNTVSFEERNNASDVKIYPNPCKQEKFTVEFNNQKIKEIRLTNIIGKEVLLKQYPFTENKKQIELTEIPDGIYLVRIKTDDDILIVKKLMVARN